MAGTADDGAPDPGAGAARLVADGVSHHRAGRLAEAGRYYRAALALDPRHADALHLSGVIEAQSGRPEPALELLRQSLQVCPDNPEALHNLGSVLRQLGRFGEAVEFFEGALRLKPNYPEALHNLGLALSAQGRLAESIARYESSLALRPAAPDVLYNLAIALQAAGRIGDAIARYEQVLRLRPDYLEALNNLGIALRKQGRLAEAVARHRQALAIAPNSPQALNNLGNTLHQQGHADEAAQCYQQALDLKPDYLNALYNLGVVLQEQGKLTEAIERYRQVVAIKPDYVQAVSQLVHQQQHLCDWSGLAALESRMLAMTPDQLADVPPFIMLGLASTPADQRRCAEAYMAKATAGAAPLFRHEPSRRPDTLRIGYLSADFHNHPIAYLTAGLFERHDRARFEVFGYSIGKTDRGAVRQRLEAGFDHFADLRTMTHQDAAKRIHGDGIDILVDLMGFTWGARPQILACRPAPVQVTYLGYPSTMGAGFIDYILGDATVTPMSHQPFYRERIVQLPVCYLPSDPQRALAGPVPSRAECGLPAEGFVFCCFNNTFKITPVMFDLWARLLRALPGSVLWLREADAAFRGHLRREAAARGVAPERLVFAPLLPSLSEHLARQRLADLFLDTLPYNAHATTSDALWVGLPVLTCIGETFAGRVAASLLTALGLPELITGSLAAYEALALTLARDPAALARLRAKLEHNRSTSPLFDGERFTRDIETAYGTMWQGWCAGRAPASS